MSRSIHVRLDERSSQALTLLTGVLGVSDSEAVRIALDEAARRRQRRSELRAEAQRLAADPADRAETAEVLDFMSQFAPDLPSA